MNRTPHRIQSGMANQTCIEATRLPIVNVALIAMDAVVKAKAE
jgi:hypothetical protein